VALEIDGSLSSRQQWHTDLLRQMTQAASMRGAVISSELSAQLVEYLNFRHVFRHAYAFELKWRKMSDLVLGAEEVLGRLEAELKVFFEPETCE
jgi:hypothetical protein